jgi:hypothetical protein
MESDTDDVELLTSLNVRIGEAESLGERAWLARVLAPALAFARADGNTFDDATRFLEKVKPGAGRTTAIDSIELLGNRAVVRCRVTLQTDAGPRSFHNLRLFVRHQERWKLLGWANEALPESEAPARRVAVPAEATTS